MWPDLGKRALHSSHIWFCSGIWISIKLQRMLYKFETFRDDKNSGSTISESFTSVSFNFMSHQSWKIECVNYSYARFPKSGYICKSIANYKPSYPNYDYSNITH